VTVGCRFRGFPLLLPLLAGVLFAAGQDRIADQVAVTVVGDQVFAATPGPGLVPLRLSDGEEVLATEARGINALVQTSSRLLGFSAEVRQWAARGTDTDERVIERRVTPRLILVRTNKRLYGFAGLAGHWGVQELSLEEEQREVLVGENVAVVVTSRRALAFSAFTGGFFSQDLSSDERMVDTTVNDNIVILSTPKRRLIFRSKLAVWAEPR
jgi:hypothetical protein